jgi:hypothetical protein
MIMSIHHDRARTRAGLFIILLACQAKPMAEPQAPVAEVAASSVVTVSSALPASVATLAEDAGPPPPVLGEQDVYIESIIKSWDRTPKRTEACAGYDYGTEGGLRALWCHMKKPALTELAEKAGAPIFLSGPHSKEAFNFKSRKSFGHYNPKLVTWLETQVPKRGSALQLATQATYDARYKLLGRIAGKTLAKITAEPKCFEKEKARYANYMHAGTATEVFMDQWFYVMNPSFCTFVGTAQQREAQLQRDGFDGGVDGNVVKTVFAFWMRRSMDGSFDSFASVVRGMLAAYDPDASATALPLPEAPKVAPTLPTAGPPPLLRTLPKGERLSPGF